MLDDKLSPGGTAAGRANDDRERNDARHRAATGGRVFPQWGIYNNFFIKNLVTSGSAGKLTQVNYAFAKLDNNQCASADAWADYQQPLGANETVSGLADSTSPGAFVL